MNVARVQVHSEPARLTMHRPAPAVEIRRTPPSIAIERRDPQVTVDNSDYRDAVSARRAGPLGEHMRDRARGRTEEAISRIAAEGDRLGAIEHRGETIAAVSLDELATDRAELVMRPVPAPAWAVTDPGGVGVDARPGTTAVTARAGRLQVEVQQGRLTVDTDVPPRLNVTA